VATGPAKPAARVHPPIDRVMDHRLLFLKAAVSDAQPSFVLSLFSYTYLPPGRSATVVFVFDRASGRGPITISDHLEVGALALDRHAPGGFADEFRAAGVVTAVFSPGDLFGPAPWLLEGAGMLIEAAWRDLSTPILASGPSPGRPDSLDIYSVLFKAGRIEVAINGARVEGNPYPDPVWRPWLGRPLSSCVVAIGEILVERSPP